MAKDLRRRPVGDPVPQGRGASAGGCLHPMGTSQHRSNSVRLVHEN